MSELNEPWQVYRHKGVVTRSLYIGEYRDEKLGDFYAEFYVIRNLPDGYVASVQHNYREHRRRTVWKSEPCSRMREARALAVEHMREHRPEVFQ